MPPFGLARALCSLRSGSVGFAVSSIRQTVIDLAASGDARSRPPVLPHIGSSCLCVAKGVASNMAQLGIGCRLRPPPPAV